VCCVAIGTMQKGPFKSLSTLLYFVVGPEEFARSLPWCLLYAVSALGALTSYSLGGPTVWGGTASNVITGCIFFLIHLFYFYLRFITGGMPDLAPTLQRYVRPKAASEVEPPHLLLSDEEVRKDENAVAWAAIGVPVSLCIISVVASVYNNVQNYKDSQAVGGYNAVIIPVICGVMCLPIQLYVLLASAHLVALVALSVLHQRRLVHLSFLLRDRNMALVSNELTAPANSPLRAILARPLSSSGQATRGFFTSTCCAKSAPSAAISSTNPLAILTNSGSSGEALSLSLSTEPAVSAHDIDQFLCLYNAVRLELTTHAQRWQVPTLFYAAAAGFIFAGNALGSVKALANSTLPAFDIWLVGLLGLLALLVFTLGPAVSLNSAWPRLIETHSTSLESAILWSKWAPAERLVLCNYFTANPLIFPMGGITFNWSGVQALVAAALSPTIIAGITQIAR
jgi:hypothetical protein